MCADSYLSGFIFLAITYHWPLHQLDVKNAFVNNVLDEEVYMEQPPVLLPWGVRESVQAEEVFDWSGHWELGLGDLLLLLRLLASLVLRRITLYFGDNIKGRDYFL